MSALRLGRLPDGTRHVLILEPAVGRTSFTRYGIHGGGEYVVAPSAKYSAKVEPRKGAHARKFVDPLVMETPDNGGVEIPSPEVSR
jgi:hypothetical protein